MRPDYRGYELAKATWLALHPCATSSQYEAAMRAIAKRYGV